MNSLYDNSIENPWIVDYQQMEANKTPYDVTISSRYDELVQNNKADSLLKGRFFCQNYCRKILQFCLTLISTKEANEFLWDNGHRIISLLIVKLCVHFYL